MIFSQNVSKAHRILRRSLKFVFVIMVFVLGVTAYSYASSPDPVPETPEEIGFRQNLKNLLAQHQFSELDRVANDIQHKYETGKITDSGLVHAFRAFNYTNQSEKEFLDWIEAYPRSYAASLAHAIFLRSLTYLVRGDSSINQTDPARLSAMQQYHQATTYELNRSLALTAKPLLTYNNIILLSMLTGDFSSAQSAERAAHKIDPHSFVIHYVYFSALQTRWGGSLQKMIDYRQEAQNDGLSVEQLAHFDRDIAIEKAWLEQPGTIQK